MTKDQIQARLQKLVADYTSQISDDTRVLTTYVSPEDVAKMTERELLCRFHVFVWQEIDASKRRP